MILWKSKYGLPKDLNLTRFRQNGVAHLVRVHSYKTLQKKNETRQIRANMMKAAYPGIRLMSSEAHLVPYGNTPNFMIDYRGAEKLVKKYSIKPVDCINSFIVRRW